MLLFLFFGEDLHDDGRGTKTERNRVYERVSGVLVEQLGPSNE